MTFDAVPEVVPNAGTNAVLVPVTKVNELLDVMTVFQTPTAKPELVPEMHFSDKTSVIEVPSPLEMSSREIRPLVLPDRMVVSSITPS